MTTSFAAGELYFIGELDPVTGADTGFCKIGIVREAEGRFSGKRLKEHQTGNPRRLVLHETISSEIVETVETTLHGLHATRRFSGEWFLLPPDARATVLLDAARLAREASAGIADLRRAAELRRLDASGDAVTPDRTVLDLHDRGLQLRSRSKRVATVRRAIGDALRASIVRDGGTNRFGSTGTRSGGTSFDETSFREAEPGLWEQYLVDREKPSGKFLWVDDDRMWDEFEDLHDLELSVDILLSKEHTDGTLDRLHHYYLLTLGLQAADDWEFNLVEAALKSACGHAPGITGVCKWARTTTVKKVLDTVALKSDLPDVHAKFSVTRQGTSTLEIARDRGFRL